MQRNALAREHGVTMEDADVIRLGTNPAGRATAVCVLSIARMTLHVFELCRSQSEIRVRGTGMSRRGELPEQHGVREPTL